MRTALALTGCALVTGLAGCSEIFSLEAGVLDPDAIASGCTTAGPDEDGDGCTDLDDNCPHIANPGQADSERDGVGDVCDPNPDEMGDTILAFVGDFTPPEPLFTFTGDWDLRADAAYFETVDALVGGEIVYAGPRAERPRILFRAQIDEPLDGGPLNRVYAFAHRSDEGYVACDLQFRGDYELVVETLSSKGLVPLESTMLPPSDVSPPFTLTFFPVTNLSCTYDGGLNVVGVAAETPVPFGDDHGVAVAGYSLRIEWILVLDRPDPT